MLFLHHQEQQHLHQVKEMQAAELLFQVVKEHQAAVAVHQPQAVGQALLTQVSYRAQAALVQ
jgi:electron transfer flavoprotein alpha subunit